MDIIANWLAGLPNMPKEDEFGRPWAMHQRTGMTPAQARFFAEIKRGNQKETPASLPAQASAQDCPAMVYRNGVADDTHLYYMDAGKLARRDLGNVDHVGDLLQICLETGLEAIWILTETQLSDRATRAFVEDARTAQVWEITNAQYTRPEEQTDGQARASFLKAYKKKGARGRRIPGQDQGRAVYLGFAEHSYSYKFEDIHNPVVLLAAISYTEDAIAAPIRFSAQTTGKNLMRSENSSETRAPWIAPVDFSPFSTVYVGGRDVPVPCLPATDLVWMRSLTAQEIEQGYLVTADKNSMYAGACTSVQLGEGEPVYKAGAEINAGKLEIGIYHIKLTGSSRFDGKQLPHPTDGQADSWQWVYTVKLCMDLGYQVEIIEGYTWARSHTTLRTWAEKLWKSRVALKTDRKRYSNDPARLAACEVVQKVIRGAMGLLAHPPEYPDRPGAYDWYRPDWNALIVDHARVKMFYVIRKYADMGYIPFGVLTDCIYFICATDDHAQALPGMFDRAGELGGYKRKVERPVTSKQIAALQARRGNTITEVNLSLLKYDRGEIELQEIA
jgi:hypothetical protein